jgi:hypothetical protein
MDKARGLTPQENNTRSISYQRDHSPQAPIYKGLAKEANHLGYMTERIICHNPFYCTNKSTIRDEVHFCPDFDLFLLLDKQQRGKIRKG